MNVSQKLEEALQLHRAGRLEQAEDIYCKVLKKEPRHPDALHLYGLLLHQRGRHREAAQHIERAIGIRPGIAGFHNSCGEAYRALGERDQARRCYETALRLDPRLAQARNNLGSLLAGAGELEQALEHYRQALALQPRFAQARFNLGSALQRLGRSREAIEALRESAALDPRFLPAWLALGNACRDAGLLEEAQTSYERGLALDARNAPLLNNLGVLLMRLGRHARAVEVLRGLAERDPGLAEAQCNLGVALHELDRLEEAAARYRRAIELQPDHFMAQCNLARALRDQGRVAESIREYEAILARDAGNADAHFGLAFSCLLAGDYARGWREYEWRWQASNAGSAPKVFAQPAWQGQPLDGRTLLVYTEQGAGDAIQCARFLPRLAAQGARVIVQCPAALRDLLATAPGVSEVVAEGGEPPPFDYHVAIMSLPHRLGIGLEDVAMDAPYLCAPPGSSVALPWRDGEGLMNVGVVWSGSALHLNNRKRSLPPHWLTRWAMPGVRLVSLQLAQGLAPEFLPPGDLPLTDVGDALTSYAATAAVLERLDLVITVDTSVAHLAGALGRPAWLLLARAPDWRWLLGCDDSPWYPSLRLFRQDAAGDWSAPVERVRAALEALRSV